MKPQQSAAAYVAEAAPPLSTGVLRRGKMKRFEKGILVLWAIVIAGCSRTNMPAIPVKATPQFIVPSAIALVPSEQLSAFLNIVKSQDFHGMWREGEKLFHVGHYIPDHAARFKGFKVHESKPGQLRYEFYSFKGRAGAGSIALFLDKVTGKIIKFSPIEASL